MIRWGYSDDGDLISFSLQRDVDGVVTDLGAAIRGKQGLAEFLDSSAPAGPELIYTLSALTRNGNREILRTEGFRHQLLVMPMLGQNFPNPFSTITAIPVAAPPGESVELHILDAAGRLVRVLRSPAPAGGGVIHWDGRDTAGRLAPAGVYFYRFPTQESTRPLKMILKR